MKLNKDLSPKLDISRLQFAEYERNTWVATPIHGTKIESVLNEAYFSHHAARIKPFDFIEVRPEDETYFAVLLVRASGVGYVKCTLFHHLGLQETAPAPDMHAGYEIQWAGPRAKFRVKRKSDGVVLKDEFAQKPDAARWLAEHVSAMSRSTVPA